MKIEEADLSFAEFGDPKRPYTAPRKESEEVANYMKDLAHPEGFDGSLRSLVEPAHTGGDASVWFRESAQSGVFQDVAV